jgi:hypothetical protein
MPNENRVTNNQFPHGLEHAERVAPSNPLDIPIVKSPLYQEPRTDVEDVLGDLRVTQQHIEKIKAATDTPEVREERARIRQAHDRQMAGYYRDSERITEFAPEPRSAEEEEQ